MRALSTAKPTTLLSLLTLLHSATMLANNPEDPPSTKERDNLIKLMVTSTKFWEPFSKEDRNSDKILCNERRSSTMWWTGRRSSVEKDTLPPRMRPPTGAGRNLSWPTMPIAISSCRARAISSKTTTCLVLRSSLGILIWNLTLLSRKEIHSNLIPMDLKHLMNLLRCTLQWVHIKHTAPEENSTAMELDTRSTLRRDQLLQQLVKLEWTSAIS